MLVLGALLQLLNIRPGFDLMLDIRFVSALPSFTAVIAAAIVGILALVATTRMTEVSWSVILLILGLFVGGLGGMLGFIAALIAVVAFYVKP